MVHAVLNVTHHNHCARTILVRYDKLEPARNLGIVDENEKDVYQRQQPRQNLHDYAYRLLKQRRPLAKQRLDVSAVEHSADIVGVEVLVYEVHHRYVELGKLHLARRHALQYVAQRVQLLNHRRQEYVDHQGYDHRHIDEREYRRDYTPLGAGEPAVHVDYGLKYIGDEARNKKGQQHIAEITHQIYERRSYGKTDHKPHDAVDGPISG